MLGHAAAAEVLAQHDFPAEIALELARGLAFEQGDVPALGVAERAERRHDHHRDADVRDEDARGRPTLAHAHEPADDEVDEQERHQEVHARERHRDRSDVMHEDQRLEVLLLHFVQAGLRLLERAQPREEAQEREQPQLVFSDGNGQQSPERAAKLTWPRRAMRRRRGTKRVALSRGRAGPSS